MRSNRNRLGAAELGFRPTLPAALTNHEIRTRCVSRGCRVESGGRKTLRSAQLAPGRFSCGARAVNMNPYASVFGMQQNPRGGFLVRKRLVGA